MTTNIAQLLRQASRSLATVSPTPELEAEILLAHVMKQPRSYFRAWPEVAPPPDVCRTFLDLLERRQAGEPVAYLVGTREFWSREFVVTPQVLIPRPDTELLVEKALERIPARTSTIADLGTGSGVIAITLALERPNSQVIATDRSIQALKLARHNAKRLRAGNVSFIHTSWMTPLTQHHFDVIVSNPPYIASGDPHLKQEIRFEPADALIGGHDGLEAIREIVTQSPCHLRPGGWLLLEHGYDQASHVGRLLAESGFVSIECHHDLQGHPRITQAQWSP